MASLLEDLFAPQLKSTGMRFMRDPAALEDNDDANELISGPSALRRQASIRSLNTTHGGHAASRHTSRRGSSATTGHRRHHSTTPQSPIATRPVGAIVSGGMIPMQDIPEEKSSTDRRPSVPSVTAPDAAVPVRNATHVHHIPRATSPRRARSFAEIAEINVNAAEPTSVRPNLSPRDRRQGSVSAASPGIQWKDELPDRPAGLGLDNRAQKDTLNDKVQLPGILTSPPDHQANSTDSTSTLVNNGRAKGYLTSIAAIIATSRKTSDNEADNQWSVRTAPPAFLLDRKASVCSTCDGEGGELPESEGTAYDRWKDARSEHTIISGIANSDVLKRRDFLIKLSRAFAVYGSPSHRLEFNLRAVSDALEVESNYVVLPGLVMISFGNEDHSSSTHLVKAPQGFNMAKLSDVNALCRELTHGSMLIEEGLEALAAIRTAPEYSRPVFLATFPIVSFGISVIGFSANWLEAAAATVLGLLVGVMCLAAELYPSFTYLLDFVAALIVGLLVRVFKSLTDTGCMDETIVTLSALAILLPGLSLTISIIEISTRNMVSGTVRMFHALFTAMLLGFGMSVGPLLWEKSVSQERSVNCGLQPVNQLWIIAIFPVMSIAICIFFQAKPRQWMVMSVASVVGWVMSHFLNQIPALSKSGGQIPSALAAFAIGLVSNVYARLTHDVAVAPILAGILLLVPGSLGVRSTLGFLGANTSNGTNFAFEMLIVGISITIGLFVATLLVWPIRGPKLRYMTF
ncbi:hypothetical protein HKX48_002033 [Thoreauomyces humboldtii]|nr:hypothetical protein HKX48_002033 [Thoreauomyces humboldtii]